MPFPKMRLVRFIDDEFNIIDKTMKTLDELKKERDRGRAHKVSAISFIDSTNLISDVNAAGVDFNGICTRQIANGNYKCFK